MNRRLNRRLAAASFLILMLAVIPGMAYTGAWSAPEGDLEVIVAEEPVGSHHHAGEGHTHGSGIQQCRVGPSRCTGQPSFVATTWLGDRTWTVAPPDLTHEIAGSGTHFTLQPPVYRTKPPPRGA